MPASQSASDLQQWLLLIPAIATGILVALQPAANDEISAHLGHKVFGAMTNNLVGFTAICIMALILRPGLPNLQAALSNAPVWAWIGGLCGASYVVTSIFLVGKLGTAQLFAALVAGQLLCSALVDHFGLLNLERRPINPGRALGIALVIAGVVVVRFASKPTAPPDPESDTRIGTPADTSRSPA